MKKNDPWYLKRGQLRQSFSKARTSKSQTKEAGGSVKDLADVNNTAKIQLTVQEEIGEALDNLDRQWKQDRDKLVGSPINIPTLGPGAPDPESIKNQHDHLFTEKMHKQDRLMKFSQFLRQEARSEGQTLVGEFSKSASAPTGSLEPVFKAEESIKPRFNASAAPYKKRSTEKSKSKKI